MNNTKALLAGVLLASIGGLPAVNAADSASARVDQLLSQMTIEEQLTFIHGAAEDPAAYQGQAGYLPGIARLGIPSLRLADGPPGVLTRVPSGLPPSTLALAATFSRNDAASLGTVIGRNARARGIDVVLEPFINMARDPNTGRASNTFGEDPLLTGQIGAALIRGIQGQDVMAQAKHYVAYDGSDNVVVNSQAFHEIYLAPFADAVDAGVSSVMCAYSKINGPYSCGSNQTLNVILKGELGFKGFVTSDWGANHAAEYINAGLDMEMPGEQGGPLANVLPSFFAAKKEVTLQPPKPFTFAGVGSLPEETKPDGSGAGMKMPAMEPLQPGQSLSLGIALTAGTVQPAAVTAAARRILRQIQRFGYLDGKQKHTVTREPIEQNAPILQSVSEHSAVLLKNDGGILPLSVTDLATTAFIGPGAGQTMALVDSGEKSLGWPERQLGVVQALAKGWRGMPAHKVIYAVADDMTGVPIPAVAWSHEGAPGLLRTDTNSGTTQADQNLDFTLSNQRALPAGRAYTWRGELEIPSEAQYELYLQLMGAGGSVEVDGRPIGSTGSLALHGDVLQAGQDNVLPTTDGLDNVRRLLSLTRGKHQVVVKITGDSSGGPVQVRLAWKTPDKKAADRAAAIDAAKKAGKAVVFVWGRGRPDSFRLPGDQDQLIADIARVNPNTIVVLNVDAPLDMPWLPQVRGVIQHWYTGDEGGWATARLLTGQVSPAGRLPFTWPKRLSDGVVYDVTHPERSTRGVDGTTTYSEGIFMGYRWYDRQKIEPLFPFGFGLSYARFDYSALRIESASQGGVDVSFTVHNSGPMRSDEVPQVYLGPPAAAPDGAQFAVRSLVAFDRIDLQAGQSKRVRLHVPLRQLQYWDTAASSWKSAGARPIFVGTSSRDIRLTGAIQN